MRTTIILSMLALTACGSVATPMTEVKKAKAPYVIECKGTSHTISLQNGERQPDQTHDWAAIYRIDASSQAISTYSPETHKFVKDCKGNCNTRIDKDGIYEKYRTTTDAGRFKLRYDYETNIDRATGVGTGTIDIEMTDEKNVASDKSHVTTKSDCSKIDDPTETKRI